MKGGMEFTEGGPSVGFEDILRSLLRGLVPMAICGLVGGVAAFFISSSMPEKYESSVTLLSSRAPTSLVTTDVVAPPQVDPRVYSRAVFSSDVIDNAMRYVMGRDITQRESDVFENSVTVSVENHEISSLIVISVRNENPAQAAEYADAIASQLVAWDRDRARHVLTEATAGLERAVAELTMELEQAANSQSPDAVQLQVTMAALRDQRMRELEATRLRSASVVAVGLLEVMNKAEVPIEAVAPRVLFNSVIAAVLGLIVGYGSSLLTSRLASRERSTSASGDAVGLSVLATLPDLSKNFSLATDGLSRLRGALIAHCSKQLPAVVGLAHTGDRPQQDWIAAATAYSLARVRFKTLLIEADFAPKKTGFSDYLKDREGPSLENSLLAMKRGETGGVVRVAAGDHSFDVLPVRSVVSDASELLVRDLPSLLQVFKQKYEFILISLPCDIKDVDLMTVAPHLDAAVVITLSQRGNSAALRVAEWLRRERVELLGQVIGTPARYDLGRRGSTVANPLPWASSVGGGGARE